MSPLQARLVTLCQQTLALGVVLAVLTPASGVVSLDVVGVGPGGPPAAPVVELRKPHQLEQGTAPDGPRVQDLTGWKGRSYSGPG